MSITPQSGVGINAAQPVNLGTTGAIQNVPNITYDSQGLNADVFSRLADDSGEANMVQDATKQPLRLRYMCSPQPVAITARDLAGNPLGTILGTNYGEYAYIATEMVAKNAQGQGIGSELVKRFKAKVEQDCGGPTSIFILAGESDTPGISSRPYWQNRGFTPLSNALVLKRGQQIQ